jgi:hypothetical protein
MKNKVTTIGLTTLHEIRVFILLAVFASVVLIVFSINLSINLRLFYFFAIILLGFILTKHRREVFDKAFFKILCAIAISGIILSGGIYFFAQSNLGENNLANSKYGYYEFYIRPYGTETGNLYVNNFQLIIDYNGNIGNITFSIDGSKLDKLSNLRIGIPSEYNFTRQTLKVLGKNLSQDMNYVILYDKEYNKNVLNIMKFNTGTSNNVDFSIFFDSVNATSPNGKFHLEIDAKRVFTKDWNRKTIFLILDRYACSNPCYGDVTESILGIDNNVLSVSYPANYYDFYESNPSAYRLFVQEFGLNMQDKNMVTSIDMNRQGGIGMIVSGIVIYFQSLIEIYTFISYNKIRVYRRNKTK